MVLEAVVRGFPLRGGFLFQVLYQSHGMGPRNFRALLVFLGVPEPFKTSDRSRLLKNGPRELQEERDLSRLGRGKSRALGSDSSKRTLPQFFGFPGKSFRRHRGRIALFFGSPVLEVTDLELDPSTGTGLSGGRA